VHNAKRDLANMKRKMKLILTLAIGTLGIFLVNAEDWFQINWSGTVHFYDSTGRMVTKSYSARDVVRTIADNNGLNPNDLVLVYRPDSYDTAVVFKNAAALAHAGLDISSQVVADYLQVPDITRVGSSWVTDVSGNGQTVRQAYIFDEHSNPIGSIYGIEKQRRDADNNIASESFHGTFQFSISDTSHSVAGPGVYSGSFSTGARVKDVRQ
jgi:hypothetical protein